MDTSRWNILRINRSFLGSFVLLNIEVFNFVGLLILGDHIQEFSKAVLFQVFLGEVLKISLGERDRAVDVDFGSVVGDFDLVS